MIIAILLIALFALAIFLAARKSSSSMDGIEEAVITKIEKVPHDGPGGCMYRIRVQYGGRNAVSDKQYATVPGHTRRPSDTWKVGDTIQVRPFKDRPWIVRAMVSDYVTSEIWT